jgi:hypothetical protein
MRSAVIRASFILAFAVVGAGGDRPPDISAKPESSLQKYVDRRVMVRGRFSLRGKVAAFHRDGQDADLPYAGEPLRF